MITQMMYGIRAKWHIFNVLRRDIFQRKKVSSNADRGSFGAEEENDNRMVVAAADIDLAILPQQLDLWADQLALRTK